MTEILLCNQPISVNSLQSQCGISGSELTSLACQSSTSMLQAYRPYLIGQKPNDLQRDLLNHLGTGKQVQDLTNMSLSFGEYNTLAIAAMTERLREYGIGAMGASTSLYANRIQGFGLAVKKYQDALMDYRHVMQNNSATRVVARQKALAAFNELQSRFRHELNAVTTAIKAKKGTALGNPERGLNIARSSRNVARLNITSQIQANQLVNFTKYAKFLGNGLAVIDFGTRVGNVHNSYKSGGNWERDLFIESSSFAVSASAGVIAVNVGSAALGLLIVATPVSWVGLIVGGLAVAGTATVISIDLNSYFKENGGSMYDEIMEFLTGK